MIYPTVITDKAQTLLSHIPPRAAFEYRSSKVAVADLPGLVAEHRKEAAQHYTGKAKKFISFSEIDSCSRKIAYSFFPEHFPPEDSGNVDVRDEAAVIGTVGHAALQKAALAAGVVAFNGDKPLVEAWASDVAATREIKDALWNTYGLSGKLDMVEMIPFEPRRYTELKFIKDKDYSFAQYWFKESKKTPGKINVPFWFKPGQAQLTMWALGLDTTRFIVVSREGDWLKDAIELFYKRDEGLIHHLLNKALYIHMRVDNARDYLNPEFEPHLPILMSSVDDMLPIREPGEDGKNCTYCPFKKHCLPEVENGPGAV